MRSIAVDGHSGSGKSFLVAELNNLLPEFTVFKGYTSTSRTENVIFDRHWFSYLAELSVVNSAETCIAKLGKIYRPFTVILLVSRIVFDNRKTKQIVSWDVENDIRSRRRLFKSLAPLIDWFAFIKKPRIDMRNLAEKVLKLYIQNNPPSCIYIPT